MKNNEDPFKILYRIKQNHYLRIGSIGIILLVLCPALLYIAFRESQVITFNSNGTIISMGAGIFSGIIGFSLVVMAIIALWQNKKKQHDN